MAENEITIRPYQAEDEKEVIDLWFRCDLVVPANNPKCDIERKMTYSPELFLVGVMNGAIVATVMAGYEGHRGWINYLAVAPEFQRQGIGTEMMRSAEERLIALGCPKINLQVRAGNAGVVTFYESIGYNKDEVVSMGKRLADDSSYGV